MTNGQYLLLIAVIVACAGYLGYRLEEVAREIRRFRQRLLGKPEGSSADPAQEIGRLYRRHGSSRRESTNT
jgi:hypothetical protein